MINILHLPLKLLVTGVEKVEKRRKVLSEFILLSGFDQSPQLVDILRAINSID